MAQSLEWLGNKICILLNPKSVNFKRRSIPATEVRPTSPTSMAKAAQGTNYVSLLTLGAVTTTYSVPASTLTEEPTAMSGRER